MDQNVLLLVACAATIVFIVVLRPIAIRFGLTDQPDSRKRHTGAVPLVGGIAIYGSLVVVFGLETHFAVFTGKPNQSLLAFLTAAFLLVITGALDDRFGLSPLIRLVIGACAGLIMVYGADIVLRDLGAITLSGETIYLGVFAVPFTVFVTVGIINAVNMTDGLDGLSGNMTLVMLLGIGIANTLWGGGYQLQLLNVLSAAIIGFLILNQRVFWRSKAWVFLGDAGSMMLGLALIWSVIEITNSPQPIVSPAIGLWFLAVPLLDTVTIMIRRILKRRSPFTADAEHLHHLLVRSGVSVSGTIMIMCSMAAAGCAIGLFFRYYSVSDFIVAHVFAVVGVFYLWFTLRCWKTRRLFGRPIGD